MDVAGKAVRMISLLPRKPVWTQAVVDDLYRHYAAGLTATQIAEELNAEHGTSFTRNAVIGKQNRLKRGYTRSEISRAGGKANAGKKRKPRRSPSTTGGATAANRHNRQVAARLKREPLPMVQPTADTNVRLVDRANSQCAFPVAGADPRHGPDMLVCGAPVAAGSASYCRFHMGAAYQERRPEKRLMRLAEVVA
jgi:hypothetical protein